MVVFLHLGVAFGLGTNTRVLPAWPRLTESLLLLVCGFLSRAPKKVGGEQEADENQP